jgi:hypothetical protein
MRNRVVVLIVVAFAALGVLAGTASANGGAGGVTCTGSASKGAGALNCTGADGKTLACTATWSWRPLGFSVSCTLPDGTRKTFTWPQ